jgi:hypothetical protein
MAVALTPALSQREREIKERAARDFHGKGTNLSGQRPDNDDEDIQDQSGGAP